MYKPPHKYVCGDFICVICSDMMLQQIIWLIYSETHTHKHFFPFSSSKCERMYKNDFPFSPLLGLLNFLFLFEFTLPECWDSKLIVYLHDRNLQKGLRPFSYIAPVCPYWVSSPPQKKEKQGGNMSTDLMGCGIAICHRGHLDTYKWWRELKFQSLRVS